MWMWLRGVLEKMFGEQQVMSSLAMHTGFDEGLGELQIVGDFVGFVIGMESIMRHQWQLN